MARGSNGAGKSSGEAKGNPHSQALLGRAGLGQATAVMARAADSSQQASMTGTAQQAQWAQAAAARHGESAAGTQAKASKGSKRYKTPHVLSVPGRVGQCGSEA